MDYAYDEYYSEEVDLGAGISPCLTLHCNNKPWPIDGIPNSLTMRLNYRTVDLTRLGIGCEQDNSNLFHRAKNEKDGDFPSFLSGHPFTLVFTSFETCDKIGCTNGHTLMTSALFDDNVSNNSATHIHAVPLSLAIIKKAIQWLRGENAPGELVAEPKTVKEGLLSYFRLLQEMIPLQKRPGPNQSSNMVLKGALEFIESRSWGFNHDHLVNEMTKNINQLANNPNEVTTDEFWKVCCAARKFIYSSVAEQTKVVGHIVDGSHRLTALEYALVTPSAKKSCISNILRTRVNVPTVLSPAYVERMKILSNQTQNQQGCLKDHGIREFYTFLINLLGENMVDKYMIDPEGGHEKFTLQDDMGTFAKAVLNVLVNEKCSPFFLMVPEMKLNHVKDLIDWGYGESVLRSLFKNKSSDSGEWSLHWNEGKYTLLRSITHFKDGMHYSNRYATGDSITSTLFELAQVLMWTRVSRASHKQLSNFFSKNLSDLILQRSAGNDDLTKKWVWCMVNTVTSCVYYSYRVCLNKFKPAKEKAPDHLLPTLIMCAIESTLPFFSKYGIDPKPPEWFEYVSATLNDPDKLGEIFMENGDTKEFDESSCKLLPTDFNSFVTVAFALHLQSGILKRGENGRGKGKVREFEETMNDVTDLFQKQYFAATEGEIRWTLDIQLYVNMLGDNPDILTKTVTNMVTYLLPSVQRGKKTSTNSTAIEINQHSDEQYDSLKQLMEKFKTSSFGEYLGSIINDTNESNATKSKAKVLRSKIDDFDNGLLEKCYREGEDMEDSDEDSDNEGFSSLLYERI
jgi:hypothetical protein